jgi:hypothetical protein
MFKERPFLQKFALMEELKTKTHKTKRNKQNFSRTRGLDANL